MKQLLYGVMAVAALSLSACGSKSCKDFCSKPCNGVTTADCNANCDKADGVNTASGCTSKYNAVLSCASGLSDSDRCSTTNTTCDTPANDYLSCVTSYCTAHSTDPACM